MGQAILRSAADHVKSVHLELGGKTPSIVFADADLEQAIAGSLFTAFYNTGQICTSGSRLLVQRSDADRIIEAFVERARGIRVGDPATPATTRAAGVAGAVRARDGLHRGGQRAARARARRRPAGGPARGGYFVEPTVFTDVTPDMRIAQEEIFGPVLSVITFEDEADAIRIANDVMYGLAATVWTTDLGRAFRMAERLDAGSSGPTARTTCRSTCPTRATSCPAWARTWAWRRSTRSPTSRRTASISVAASSAGRSRGRSASPRGPARDGRDGAAGGSPSTVRSYAVSSLAATTAGLATAGGPGADPIVRSLFAPAAGTIYLDTATYGLPPRPTIEVMERALGLAGRDRELDRGLGSPSDRCRTDFAALIGAGAANIAYIPAASVGAGSWPCPCVRGDEVVVPVDEFTSTLFPLLVAARRGAVIREVPFEACRTRSGPARARRIQPRPDADWQDGRPAAICERAEAVGAGCSSTRPRPSRSCRSGTVHAAIDYLVCAGYKHLLSPRGTAYFYVRPRHWEELEPTNANWRAADQPFDRYFGGPLSLSKTAARFDVSRAWLPWLGASESTRLLSSWRESDLFPSVRRLADRLAEGTGIPAPGSSLVCVPIEGAERAREALKAAGIKASVRGTSIRFAPHVYNTEADIGRAIEVIQPFLG